MAKMGAVVDFYPERTYGTAFKLINNFFPARLKHYQATHYEKINQQTKSKSIDYLFVIRGYMMPETFLKAFRTNHPDAKLIMYQWDSDRTNPFSHLLPLFDKAFSFDFEDCKNHPSIQYLPLFYTNDVVSAIKNKNEAAYDFFFMGWFFPERYQSVLRFVQYAKENNYRLKAFLYMPFTTYIKYKLKRESLDRSIVSLKHMNRKEYLENLANSKVMVDVSNPNQTGLAMRVIESLASHTKVLTNNRRLLDDKKIYDPTKIAFFDEKNPMVQESFLNKYDFNGTAIVLPLSEWLALIFKRGE
ncbi:hypothetical protein [Mucilaginibacter flavidus]|uniref:hypothetical protein n=1 Tax=Mucilaginibacter flavidus TaxID=2949309 RepID=UPI0020928923|nr:hypothetical protein [Mucilaginibacter flavidus]MCO5947241.1 hypothetical protein [Mucilaginibacter flavidus]